MKSNSPLFSNYSVSGGKSGSSSKGGSAIAAGIPTVGVKASIASALGNPKAKGKLKKASTVRKPPKGKKSSKRPIFTKKGHVTLRSVSARREFLLGKSVARIEHELRAHGYEVTRRGSKFSGSKAKIVLTLNSSKHRNIKQIQISPGSSRHGNVPYVKISTSDYGKIKIIGADRKSYKTDGHEKAHILFRRVKKK